MKNSIFPSDESLPTWLHTLLLILIIAPFSGFLFWSGAGAVITGYLAPLSGPDFGQFFLVKLHYMDFPLELPVSP